jgi:phosphatidylserine decarboxylase
MATLTPATTPVLTSAPITSIQPGGGLVLNLELAWGRLRRAYLRRFRPGYVRRMTAKRQGECPNCPHDVIDARDLKFYRNVCGFWFRREDDAFRWRDRIPFARPGLAELVLSILVLGTAAVALGLGAWWGHWLLWLPFTAVLLLLAEVVYFFRDPERQTPADPTALVSPADGTITFVGEVDDPDFPDGRALCVTIFLSIFNVHVNRIPRSGRVLGIRYFHGCFLDARKKECGEQNEQLWLDLEESDTLRLVRVKQVVGALARRIVCWLKPGEVVKAGERYGMIKFGSRTDVLIPAGDQIEVIVRIGDKVKGGSTVLLRVKPAGDMTV